MNKKELSAALQKHGVKVVGGKVKTSDLKKVLAAEDGVYGLATTDSATKWDYVDYLPDEEDYHASLRAAVDPGDLSKVGEDRDDPEDYILEELKESFIGQFAKQYPDFVKNYQIELNLKGDLENPKLVVDFEIKFDPHDLQRTVEKVLNDALREIKNKHKN